MNEQIIKYLVNTTGALTIEDVILNFLVAAAIGGVIFLSYRITHSNAVYSARFNVSLLLLTLVTTLVMSVIGNNIALSLGMVGALSIVRFRTPIKDSRDTTYIFWCVAVGICCGVSEYMIASVGTAIIFLVLVLFGFIKDNERYLIIVRGNKEQLVNVEQATEELFGRKYKLRVKNTTKDSEEYIFELSERTIDASKKKNDIVEHYYNKSKADSVNIVCQNDEISR